VEREDAVREAAAQAVALVARSEGGCEALYACGAQESLKKGFEYEEHPATMEAMQVRSWVCQSVRAPVVAAGAER